MRFILKVDKDDMFRSADIRDLTAVETLVINSALRRYSQDESVHESDRKTAERIGYKIVEQAQTPSRPLTSIDGADLTEATATANHFYGREGESK